MSARPLATLPGLANARVLITGGAGLIGSHIADLAIEAGAARVIILDNLVRGRRENLAAATASGRLEVVVGDIRDREVVRSLAEDADIVFHQAALRITHSAEAPLDAIAVMVNGTQNVLDAAVEHRVQRVIAASSASVYGEPRYLPMDEDHPYNNRTLYGAAKIAMEQMLRAYSDMFRLQYIALRPFNVYGPRMDLHGAYTEVMVRWLDRLAAGDPPVIFGDGSHSMDFVYVADVARAYLLAAVAPHSDVVLNVGSGTETRLLDLARLMCEGAGHPDLQPVFEPARAVNAVSRRVASTERARAMLGFTATTALPDGLRELARWHRERSLAVAGTA